MKVTIEIKKGARLEEVDFKNGTKDVFIYDDGKFGKYDIPEYTLRIIKDGDNDIADLLNNITAKNTSALPHICPHCEADYSHPMKKKQSPFRGFRTGFGKVNQILSKELFEALPKGDKTKKLVAFSDSREDAAKLAKNIEEEHYNSLLKEVVIHNITDILQHENSIISALESNNQDLINKFQNDYPGLFFHINQLFVLTNANAASPEQIGRASCRERV